MLSLGFNHFQLLLADDVVVMGHHETVVTVGALIKSKSVIPGRLLDCCRVPALLAILHLSFLDRCVLYFKHDVFYGYHF